MYPNIAGLFLPSQAYGGVNFLTINDNTDKNLITKKIPKFLHSTVQTSPTRSIQRIAIFKMATLEEKLDKIRSPNLQSQTQVSKLIKSR